MIVSGRVLSIKFPRTTVRREVGSTQILLPAFRVLALGEGTAPTGTCVVLNGIWDDGISDIRLWGSNVAEVSGSSCTAVGSLPFMANAACILLLVIHRELKVRTDGFNT